MPSPQIASVRMHKRIAIPALVAALALAGTVLFQIANQADGPASLHEAAPAFFAQGLAHIIGGWDHLAFVLCLALISRGRQLAALVSCFTVGHAITLGLAAFGMVHVAVAPVETAIALSIVYLAYEAFVVGRGATLLAFRRQAGLVSMFGLLHGLGFAHSFSHLNVPQGQELASLTYFSLGIEFGQLAFVGVIATLLAALRNASFTAPVHAATSCAVALAGTFWAVERTWAGLA